MIFFFFNTGREFIIVMVKYFIKRVLKLKFHLQKSRKQQKMWIFDNWKIQFWTKIWAFSAKMWSKTL